MPLKSFYLPDFIIIGANKAGTTSVANYLNKHPAIHMCSVKEPMFFSSDPLMTSATKKRASLAKPYFAVTIDEYSELYEPVKSEATILGEASTAYLANPYFSAKLMKKIVPNVRIIAILREPADRALSAYKMCLGNGVEKRSFSEIAQNAIKETNILRNHGVKEYVRNGLYSQLLAPYFKHYDKSQILLMNYDDLKENPKDFLGSLFRFLSVDVIDIDYSRRYNTASKHLKFELEVSGEDVAKLRKVFRDDIAKLKEHLTVDRWLGLQ